MSSKFIMHPTKRTSRWRFFWFSHLPPELKVLFDDALPDRISGGHYLKSVLKFDQDRIHFAAGDDSAMLSFSFREPGFPKPRVSERIPC